MYTEMKRRIIILLIMWFDDKITDDEFENKQKLWDLDTVVIQEVVLWGI
jgi:hypothetical protein